MGPRLTGGGRFFVSGVFSLIATNISPALWSYLAVLFGALTAALMCSDNSGQTSIVRATSGSISRPENKLV